MKSQSVGSGGLIVVKFEEKPASELFDDYFYAGNGDEVYYPSKLGVSADSEIGHSLLKGGFPEISIGTIKFNGSVEVPVLFRCTNVIADLNNHYYRATLSLHLLTTLKASAESKNNASIEKDTGSLLKAYFPCSGGVISATIDGSLFLDFASEMKLSYEFENDIYIEVDWVRKNGENIFSAPRFSRQGGAKKSKTEAYFKGELFFGIKLDLGIGVLFDRVGAGAAFRLGPCIKADFSREHLTQLSEKYTEELYAKAQLDFSLKGDLSTYWYTHKYMGLFGDKTKHPLPFGGETNFFKETLNLFPLFHSRATVGKKAVTEPQAEENGDQAVTIATVTSTPVEYPLNVGFELANADTDKEFCRSIEDNSECMMTELSQSPQVFVDQLVPDCDLDKIDFDTIVARPVFRYDGLIIKAAPNIVGHGQFLSPVTYAAAKCGNYIVSGMPMVSMMSENETTFIEGNLLPIAPSASDEIYSAWTAAIHPVFITVDGNEASLIGTWHGEVSGKSVELTFEDGGSGSYNGKPFTYTVNTPRQGRVGLRFETGESMAFIVTDLTKETLTFVFNNSMKKHILKK